jgi:AraC-like DNA-binding protein
VEHVEFIDTYHFEHRYHRKKLKGPLAKFIDFVWEIEFDSLWKEHPDGFSDVLFPNTGYTYLINLGTPFTMQLEETVFPVKTDGFLPRHKRLACHHAVGNRIFGIKFKVSPVVFQKRINFAEYKEYIYPLAYLIDRDVVEDVKAAQNFRDRVSVISNYYNRIIARFSGSLQYVEVVTDILDNCYRKNRFTSPVEEVAKQYAISSRTLQRYFEAATSLSSKQALQIMRIRKAVETLVQDPAAFDFGVFGYYDYSHFYKHLRQFIGKEHFKLFQQRYLSATAEKNKGTP